MTPRIPGNTWGLCSAAPGPDAAPALGAVTSARPHLAAFLHQSEPAWGTIPEALTSFGILQPAHPFFHHGTGSPAAPGPQIPAATAALGLGSTLN